MLLFKKTTRFVLLFCLAVLAVGQAAFSQANQLKKVLMPSPEVQAFQKYGDIPVSTYNGIPSISIPIYTIQSHDISVPISLSYHASGIKVNENASRVGLGWVLNAGGVISRNVVGFDDFQGGHYLNARTTRTPIPDFVNGVGPAFSQFDFWNHPGGYPVCQVPIFNKTSGNSTLQNLDYRALLDKTQMDNTNLADFQPDQFYYNAGSLNGKFIIKHNGEVVIQNQEKIKIAFANNDATSWTITGQDGTIYTFAKYEESYNPSDGTGYMFKTAWQLTNITSPKGNQVNFYYTTLQGQLQPSSSYSESKELFKTCPGHEDQTYLGASLPEYHTAVFGNIYTLQVLDHIDYDNGRVSFTYTDDRVDLTGEKKLVSISIFNKDNQGNLNSLPTKKVVFNYSYFVSPGGNNTYATSTGGDPLRRLKLESVVENGYYGGKIVPGSPYVFSYFEGNNNNLPPKTSFAVDHWGYYNGRGQNTSFLPSYSGASGNTIQTYNPGPPGPEREPDTSFVRAGSLYKIQYPTGGTTEFQFEANDFDDTKSISNDNSLYTNQTALASQTASFTYYADTHQVIGSNVLDMSKEYVDGMGNIVPGKLNCSFRLSGGQGVINSLQQNLMYISVKNASGSEVLHIDPANYTQTPQFLGGPYYTYSTGSSVISLNNVPLNLSPGVYTWEAYSTTTNYAVYLMDIHSIFTWTTRINYDLSNSNSNSPTAYLAGGGMRVKRVIDHDGINPDRIKRFIYHYTAMGADNQLHEYSYGKRMSKPQYTFWQPAYDWFYETTAMGIHFDWSAWFDHMVRSSESDISLSGSGAGAVVAYDKVVVLNGENGENGKSEYTYINEPDYVPGYVNSNYVQEKPPYNSNLPNTSNGSLLKQIDYINEAGNFKKVKEITNYYASMQTLENEVFAWERRDGLWHYYLDGAQTSQINNGPGPCEDMELLAYRAMVSKFTYLLSTEEKLYDPGDTTRAITTLTYNFHDNNKHLLTTRTVKVNSKGEKVTSNITYPLDYSTANSSKYMSQGIEALKTKNIIGAPIETYTTITNADNSNSRVTNAILLSYNQYTAFPDTVFQTQSVTPLTSFARLKDTTYVKNTAYKPLIVFDGYDTRGNIIQQHKVDDVNHNYLWAYNGSFPIAEMIGSSSVNTIAYTSFEEPGGYGNTTGNFLYTGPTTFDPTSPTGKYCYSLAGGSVSALSSVISTSTYIVSYWTKNSTAYTITGTISGYPKQGKILNGWTYFEHKITGVTSITLSGSGLVDELRLYPDGALMTTYAFDPSAGMTESMDAKGLVNHFEYDGLMRLQNIKDQYGNIVKNYQYNYYSAAYGNAAKDSSYTRNNCPANTTPGAPVLVSIPANKYYAYSTSAANAAAQADLDYNAQNYANANCSCTTTSVTVTLTNSTGVSGFQAYFSGYNSFAFPANGTTTITVPAGTYNITINPINAPTTRKFTLSSSSTGGSTVVTAPGTTFSSIAVNTGVNNVLTIQAP